METRTMRMIDENYDDHPDNKASHCAKVIADYYHRYEEQKGTQFVFSDLGTYRPDADGFNVYSEITIDEGAMDEQSGIFSEYMAILSGNTDLFDKAKLEKKIASLEGERKSFNKGRRESELKLESKTNEFNNNAEKIRGMTEDWEKFTSAAKTDGKGNRINALKINGLDSTEEKAIGKRLQEIAKNATTGGRYKEVGELYGFKVMVVNEETFKDGLPFIDNRFVVEGNFRYTFNNGRMAMADTHAAAMNFINALEKIPSIIEQYKEKNETLAAEIPRLKEIAEKTWKKEDELKQLKSELAALERKIQMELAPQMQEQEMKQKTENVATECEVTKREENDSFTQKHIHVVRPDDGIASKRQWQRSL